MLVFCIFSFLCHLSVSSSFGGKPIKSEDLPVLLGHPSVGKDSQSQDFQVYKLQVSVA